MKGTCKFLLEPECGVRFLEAKRIVGGRISSPGAWPWQVALLLNNTQMCGGSLVSPEWVVSASHCFVGKKNRLFCDCILIMMIGISFLVLYKQRDDLGLKRVHIWAQLSVQIYDCYQVLILF